MILLGDVRKRFGEVEALRGVSFSVADGQITGLLGPNGAGKTTALRIVYGVMAPDSGHASVDGLDLGSDRLAAQARLGVLAHAQGLYPRLTAREQVRYAGQLHGLRGPALERRIDELAEVLELGDFLERRADGFSQGQKLKVALARALVNDPRNLVFDEPTSGLDVAGTRAVRALLKRLRDQGRCVLFSTHVMQEVSAVCDRVVVMARGLVVAEGTPEGLKAATGQATLEDAFVKVIGSDEGLG